MCEKFYLVFLYVGRNDLYLRKYVRIIIEFIFVLFLIIRI